MIKIKTKEFKQLLNKINIFGKKDKPYCDIYSDDNSIYIILTDGNLFIKVDIAEYAILRKSLTVNIPLNLLTDILTGYKGEYINITDTKINNTDYKGEEYKDLPELFACPPDRVYNIKPYFLQALYKTGKFTTDKNENHYECSNVQVDIEKDKIKFFGTDGKVANLLEYQFINSNKSEIIYFDYQEVIKKLEKLNTNFLKLGVAEKGIRLKNDYFEVFIFNTTFKKIDYSKVMSYKDYTGSSIVFKKESAIDILNNFHNQYKDNLDNTIYFEIKSNKVFIFADEKDKKELDIEFIKTEIDGIIKFKYSNLLLCMESLHYRCNMYFKDKFKFQSFPVYFVEKNNTIACMSVK